VVAGAKPDLRIIWREFRASLVTLTRLDRCRTIAPDGCGHRNSRARTGRDITVDLIHLQAGTSPTHHAIKCSVGALADRQGVGTRQGARSRPGRNRRKLMSPAGFPVSTAIALALFSQPILVQACGSEFAADVPARRPLTAFPVSAAIAFAAFTELVSSFACQPQLFALAAATSLIDAHSARPDFDTLRHRRVG